MDAVALVRRLHQHRMWVNGQLVEAAESLSADQLEHAFPIGQGSVWKSLLHLYAAEYVWLEALMGDESPVVPGDLPNRLPGNQEAKGAMTSLGELKDHWSALDERWTSFLDRMTEAQLSELVWKTSTRTKVRQATSQSDILLHVCTHAHYTTAQVVNMLRQLGVDSLPDAMLIIMSRSE